MDVIGQSGKGLIRCHGCDSIPLLGLSPRGDNVGSTLSVCGHCLSSKSLVSEYIRLTFGVSQPIFCSSHIFIIYIMSSGNITNSSNNSNGADKINWQCVASPDLLEQVEDSLEVQITKFDEQSCCQCNKLMKRVAEQEAQRKANEERKKAKEEAKRVAEEEAKRLTEKEAKKKVEEEAQKRAKFQVWWQAESERKAKEKAEAKAAGKAMKAWIAQNAVQGVKPKPKVCGMELVSSFLLLIYSSDFSNVGQPVSAHPTRRSRGGTPHVTNAGRVATARAASCPTTHTCQRVPGARR